LEILLLVLLGVLWGMPYALNKITLVSIPPVTMVAIRVTLAAATLCVIVPLTGCAMPREIKIIARLGLQGLIGCVIPYTLIAIGQKTVDSALASILNSTGPLFVCVIGLLSRDRESPAMSRILGIAVGLGGVVIITGADAISGLGQSTFGQSAILVATLSSAFSAIHGRRFTAIAPELVAAGTLGSAALLLLPMSFVLESPLNCSPSASAVLALLTNAAFGTALGFVVYFRLIRTLGSLGTVSVGYLRPAVGVLIGSLLLAENLTPTIVFGLVAILVGVTAINSKDSLPWLRTKIGRHSGFAGRAESAERVVRPPYVTGLLYPRRPGESLGRPVREPERWSD
jgi:drug/metabolite transporter (DMT)-like permease